MTGWTEEGVMHSWRALSQQIANEEWRFVHLAKIGGLSLEVGRHFPFGREALIVSLPRTFEDESDRLPEGRGFDVFVVNSGHFDQGTLNFALVRRLDGSPEIFGTMVVEILRHLENLSEASDKELVQSFFQRVREWQDFMTRTQRPLSSEAQIGLFGELWMLTLLLNSDLASRALDCWTGPLAAAQDFHVADGALEVKSTIGHGKFHARINSIEQLDTDRTPCILCALRFEVIPDGQSLPDAISHLRQIFGQAGTQTTFDALLMVMGYDDQHQSHYGRRYSLIDANAFLSEGRMPRLTRASLHPAIRQASYVLDLDALATPTVGFAEVFKALGVQRNES